MMSEALFNSVRIYQEAVKRLKKTKRFFFLLLLATIPYLSYEAVALHTIKIGGQNCLRCEVEELERNSWSWDEIKKFTTSEGPDKDCYVKDYNYSKFINKSFDEAKKLAKQDPIDSRARRNCAKFIMKRNLKQFPETYPDEFAKYCRSLKYESVYDAGATTVYILSCVLIVPLADIMGRKRIFALGCRLAYIAVFIKVLALYFVREVIGELFIHMAYPVMKFTTQAIIFEISPDSLRPFAFVIISTGLYIPLIIFPLLPPIYWKSGELLCYSAVLLLPLPMWYFPESPLWFMSKRKAILSLYYTRTLDKPREHNDLLLNLRNRVTDCADVKALLKEFKKINREKIALVIGTAFCVGYISYYFYARHKLQYIYFDHTVITASYHVTGLLATFLVLPAVYWLNRTRLAVGILFFVNGVFFCLLIKRINGIVNIPYEIEILITCIDITSTMLKIFYEFYLNEFFPTSHRCTCIGIYGATLKIGLLCFIGIRQWNRMFSFTVGAAACLTGCILAIFLKDLERFAPLALQFEDLRSRARASLEQLGVH